jgi:hypothetical protein
MSIEIAATIEAERELLGVPGRLAPTRFGFGQTL